MALKVKTATGFVAVGGGGQPAARTVGWGTAMSSDAALSLDFNQHAGTIVGDLLVAAVYGRKPGGLFTPSGWTKVAERPCASVDQYTAVFTKVASSNGAVAHSLALNSASGRLAGVISTFRNAASATLVGSSTGVGAPSFDLTIAGSPALGLFCSSHAYASDGQVNTYSGISEIITGAQPRLSAAIAAAPQMTVTRTASIGDDNVKTYWAAILVAITP